MRPINLTNIEMEREQVKWSWTMFPRIRRASLGSRNTLTTFGSLFNTFLF
jgi:hypothetical protein